MDKHSKIFIAGHTGVIGNAIYRSLEERGYRNLIVRKHSELDLLDESAVHAFFQREKIEYAFFCAGRGGNAAHYQKNSAEIMYQLIMMQTIFMEAARKKMVHKVLYLGSCACYGQNAKVPWKETDAINSIQHGMMEPYSVTKIAGIEMCKAYSAVYDTRYISVLPTHVFSASNLKKETPNILEAIILSIYSAKAREKPVCNLDIWGKGKALTAYLFDMDLADMCIYLMTNYDGTLPVNAAYDTPCSLSEIADFVAGVFQYDGKLVFAYDKTERTDPRYPAVDYLKSLGYVMEKDIFWKRLKMCCESLCQKGVL